MADYGLKISKPGKSVYSSNPSDFTLHSKYNTLKVLLQGKDTVTLSDSSTGVEQEDVDITHSLGYNPIFFAYYNFIDGTDDVWFPIPSLPSNLTPSFDFGAGFSYPDTNTVRLTFLIYDKVGEYTVTYKYYVCIDPNKEAWS